MSKASKLGGMFGPLMDAVENGSYIYFEYQLENSIKVHTIKVSRFEDIANWLEQFNNCKTSSQGRFGIGPMNYPDEMYTFWSSI